VAAAEKLIALELAPVDVYRELEVRELAPPQRIEALRALHVPDRGAMEALYAIVDRSDLQSTPYRHALAQEVSDPMLYDLATALWSEERPHLRDHEGLLLSENLELARPPFASEFFLGWQPPETDGRTHARYFAPSGADLYPKGYVQLVFKKDSEDKPYRWTFYRFPLRGGIGLDVEVEVRCVPPELSRTRLTLKVEGRIVEQVQADAAKEGWQTLRLHADSTPQPTLVELVLERHLGGRRPAEALPPEVHLGPVTLRPVSP
jgi:hypothetical protein